MMQRGRFAQRFFLSRAVTLFVASTLLTFALPISDARSQETGQQTGSIGGTVTDEQGAPIGEVQVFIEELGRGAVTNPTGAYLMQNVPEGTHTVRARIIGFSSDTATVTVAAGQRAAQDFTLGSDPLSLDAVVVTGTQTPRVNLESSVAVTSLPAAEVQRAAPRSSTEFLRYVPGFTRVESSGGEVNQNYSVRGILGVEYVNFMEDGLPVFPTMHTFFMNADNLFRFDENIERVEVVRGGTSALFGSNTPGAIVNLINKTGGPEIGGVLRASAATEGLARYDFNLNGPLGDEWSFNLGGFYRYDHGVRDPGFPGIRGGQFKANVTRRLESGHLRASVKFIDDRNQFILPLPFQNPDDPEYVAGFSDYGSMNTREGNNLRVPIPPGELVLPLDEGLRTQAYWLTANADFEFGDGWTLRNAAQIMENQQQWNAIVPSDLMPAAEFITRPPGNNGLGLPEGTPFQFLFTNHRDVAGNKLPFDTENGFVAPSEEIHVDKPLSAFQNQLQIGKALGPHNLTLGLYFANYTQDNHWYITRILTDVRDNPRFLDLLVFSGADTINVTQNGFRRFLAGYTNGSGQTTIVSGVIGGEFQLTDRLRSDLAFRYEFNDFVQNAENTSTFDLDGDTTTTYDAETFGNGSFRHFGHDLDDWAASVGLNYTLTDEVALYAAGSRSYKMPALDEFLNFQSQDAVDLVRPSETLIGELGVKYSAGRFAFTVNGFYTERKDIVGQGLIISPVTGEPEWTIQASPEDRAFGVELEGSASPLEGLTVLAAGTFLDAEYAECPDTVGGVNRGCPSGADVGTFLLGIPEIIGNLSARYVRSGFSLHGDWHFVGSRFSTFEVEGEGRNELPEYSYFNFGVSYELPRGITLSADLLNAFQSKGLEEGNPRLSLIGGRTSDLFLARPILPRRFLASLRYDF